MTSEEAEVPSTRTYPVSQQVLIDLIAQALCQQGGTGDIAVSRTDL